MFIAQSTCILPLPPPSHHAHEQVIYVFCVIFLVATPLLVRQTSTCVCVCRNLLIITPLVKRVTMMNSALSEIGFLGVGYSPQQEVLSHQWETSTTSYDNTKSIGFVGGYGLGRRSDKIFKASSWLSPCFGAFEGREPSTLDKKLLG